MVNSYDNEDNDKDFIIMSEAFNNNQCIFVFKPTRYRQAYIYEIYLFFKNESKKIPLPNAVN